MSYEAGLEAFQQNKFEDAIAHLLKYCQECDASNSVTSQKYMQAHRGIVKCYQQLQQLEQAIAHCQSLTETKNTALNIWIDRTLPKLQAAAEKASAAPDSSENNPEDQLAPVQDENEMLLHQGIQAYKDMKRDRALKLLEEYTASCTRETSRNYMNAQITLVKTYREVKDFDQAIARCETLATSENFALKSWASKALPKLREELAKINPPAPTDETTTPTAAINTAGADASLQTASPVTKIQTPVSPATDRHPIAPSPTSNDRQLAASSSYVFDATPNGSPTLQQVTPSSNLLSTQSEFASVKPSNSPSNQPHRSTPVSQAGDLPDSMADGLATPPKRTSSSRMTQPTSSLSRSASRSSKTHKSEGGGGTTAIGGGIAAVLGQFVLRRTLRVGIGFVVFTVIVIARSCFNIGSDMTPLQTAVIEGNVATVEKLLNQGKSMETTDESGNTVIFWALDAAECNADWTSCTMSTEQQAIADLLVSKGANVNVVNTWQETPLHWAVGVNGSAEIVQDIINQGANVNARDMTQVTPLHRAAAAGITESVEVLLNNGADINAKDSEGYTPLDYAVPGEEVATLLQSRQAISGF